MAKPKASKTTKAPKVGSYRGGAKSTPNVGRGGFMGKTTSGGNLGRTAMTNQGAAQAASGYGRGAGDAAAAFGLGGGASGGGVGNYGGAAGMVDNTSGIGLDQSASGLIESIVGGGGVVGDRNPSITGGGGPLLPTDPLMSGGGVADVITPMPARQGSLAGVTRAPATMAQPTNLAPATTKVVAPTSTPRATATPTATATPRATSTVAAPKKVGTASDLGPSGAATPTPTTVSRVPGFKGYVPPPSGGRGGQGSWSTPKSPVSAPTPSAQQILLKKLL